MNKFAFWGLLFSVLATFFSCQPQKSGHRVILVNIRGAAYAMLQKYVEVEGREGYLGQLFNRQKIRPLQPVPNAVTATNLASFETGVFPAKHGIIGHTFGSVENRHTEPISGFSKLFETETIWETASANGLQVLTIGSLLLHGSKEEIGNVHAIAQGQALGNARVIRLVPASTASNSSYAEFAQPLVNQDAEANGDSISLQGAFSVYFHQVDTLRDGREYYHALLADNDPDPENGHLAKLHEGEWCEIITGKQEELDVALRLKLTKWDKGNQRIEVFARSPFVNRGRPLDFVQKVESDIGACKGWLSIANYFAGEVSEETIREEIDSEVDYVMDVLRFGVRQRSYNLIVLDYPLLDRYGHLFTMTNSRQEGYSREVEKRYERYVFDAYRRLDNDLAEIAQLAKDGNYHFIAASGHGFSAIHSSINVNRWLEEKGFASQATDKWQVRAFPGKVSAHIYVNQNTVATAMRGTLLQKLQDFFDALTDPATDQSIVDETYTHDELQRIGLDHVNAGNLWVLLKPGYVFQREQFSERPTLDEPTFRGDHGYEAKYAENVGLIISENLSGHRKDELANIVDIAPSVAHLLNIAPSDKVDGRSLFGGRK